MQPLKHRTLLTPELAEQPQPIKWDASSLLGLRGHVQLVSGKHGAAQLNSLAPVESTSEKRNDHVRTSLEAREHSLSSAGHSVKHFRVSGLFYAALF